MTTLQKLWFYHNYVEDMRELSGDDVSKISSDDESAFMSIFEQRRQEVENLRRDK